MFLPPRDKDSPLPQNEAPLPPPPDAPPDAPPLDSARICNPETARDIVAWLLVRLVPCLSMPFHVDAFKYIQMKQNELKPSVTNPNQGYPRLMYVKVLRYVYVGYVRSFSRGSYSWIL